MKINVNIIILFVYLSLSLKFGTAVHLFEKQKKNVCSKLNS